jgi:hypothetical protein
MLRLFEDYCGWSMCLLLMLVFIHAELIATLVRVSRVQLSLFTVSLKSSVRITFIVFIICLFVLIQPSVLALPHFTQIPSNLTAWEGDVVSIPCEARGLPTPTTFWILEGNQDSLLFPECMKSNTSLLYLDGAKPEHSGRVICTAVNAAGSIMQEAYLTILKKGNNELKEPSLNQDVTNLYERDEHMTQYELVQARKYLQQNVLAMRRVEALSSTSLKVVWDVCTPIYII